MPKMKSLEAVFSKKKTKKSKKTLNKICFDPEIVPKNEALKVLNSVREVIIDDEKLSVIDTHDLQFQDTNGLEILTNTYSKSGQDKNETPKKPIADISDKSISKRAQKREKNAVLLNVRKNQHDVVVQKNNLNYLSAWKHNRKEWRFKKLKQIWLQRNVYDSCKIPDEFWDILMEYFGSANNSVKETLIKSASQIIMDKTKTNCDDNLPKIKRAKDILQSFK